MTRFALIIAAATAFGAAAQADQSDRYNDLRFNSAAGHIDYTDERSGTAQTNGARADRDDRVTFSITSRQVRQTSPAYAYSNPYGVGPYNDSR